MRDIATATLSGNLTRDPELRRLPSGADLARLRIATNTRRRSGEEWVDKTNYFTVEVFGGQARACAEYLSKGSRVFIEAEPDWREWEDQQTGSKREAVTFKARQVIFVGGRAEGPNGNHATTPPEAASQPPATNPWVRSTTALPPPLGRETDAGIVLPDDIPF